MISVSPAALLKPRSVTPKPSKPGPAKPSMPDSLRLAIELGELAADLGANRKGSPEDFARIRKLLQQLRCTR